MSTHARTLASIFGSLLTLAACQRSAESENREEKANNAKKVTADSTDDATEPIVDEDFRFRLTLPGAGWKLLRQRDAMQMNPDAVAGALNSGSSSYGIVIVERLPGTTLDQAKTIAWTEDLDGYEIEWEVDLDFQGVPAKRRAFRANVRGQPIQFLSTIFMRQDHFHQLMSWSAAVAGTPAVELQRFHDAFELLDGEIRGRTASHTPIVDADGVGWRIREGRYESALGELRARPSDGWRFIIGSELEMLSSDAEIVFMHEGRNAYLALVVERVSKERRESLAQTARNSFALNRTAPAVETFERQIAGRPVEFHRFDEPPLGYLQGVYVGDEAITQVVAWYPLNLAGEAMTSLDEMFAGFAPLPANERAQLRQELLGSAGSQRQFSKDLAYRAGVFLDYEHHLRWTKPPGFWQVDSFSKSAAHSAETVLKASEIDLGVHMAIEAFPSEADANDTLTNLIDGDEVLSREDVIIGGIPVHRAKTIDPKQSPPMSYEFATTRRGELLVAISTWSADDSPAHRETMDAAMAGLEYDMVSERTNIVDGVYTDIQHGFSFTIPMGLDRPTIKDLGLAQVAAWASGQQELVSMFITGAAVTDDEDWIMSYFEQVLRDRFSSEHMVGKPTRSEVTLGGHAARHLLWKQDRGEVSADIVVQGTIVYCFIYANLSDRQVETVRNSWSLLE